MTYTCMTFQCSISRNPAQRTVLVADVSRGSRVTWGERARQTSRERPKEIARKYSQFIQIPFYGENEGGHHLLHTGVAVGHSWLNGIEFSLCLVDVQARGWPTSNSKWSLKEASP